MVAGLLLAKAGLRVLVLEQGPDFAREYRGEVLMPRFTQMMRQIGLFEFLEKYPHRKLTGLEGFYKNRLLLRIGIDQIAPEAPFAIWMPQPVMLGALHDKSKELPSFELWFGARVKDAVEEDGRTIGVMVIKNHEEILIRSKVVVGADGRFSVLRKFEKFKLDHESHKFDLVWFTVPEPAGYNHQVGFYLSQGRNYLILPKHPNALQVGVVIGAGEYTRLHKEGIDAFRRILLETHQPVIEKFAREVKDFDSFNVLQAKIEHVEKWAKDGIVLIGDAAHTCSPAGAIGVSVAVETAIVTADVIRDCFRRGDFSANALGKIQQIRDNDVRGILKMQERVSALLFPKSEVSRKWIMPFTLFVIARLGLFKNIQRRLMVLPSALPVSKDLGFIGENWGEVRDLNPQRPDPQSGALPG